MTNEESRDTGDAREDPTEDEPSDGSPHESSNGTPPAPAARIASAEGWLTAVRSAVVLLLLAGVVYPLGMTLVAGGLYPEQATGSLIRVEGEVFGSRLVGQPFAAERYFHGRPSAADYDPFAVSGSNQAPSNPDLRESATDRAAAISRRDNLDAGDIPIDLVAASGSGIDPHITPAAAAIQIERVSRVRELDRQTVESLVEEHTDGPTFGILGQPRVNVLELNLALDRAASS